MVQRSSPEERKKMLLEAKVMVEQGNSVQKVLESLARKYNRSLAWDRLRYFLRTGNLETAAAAGQQFYDAYGTMYETPKATVRAQAPQQTRVHIDKPVIDPIEDLLSKLLQLMRQRTVKRISLDDTGKITVEKVETYSL